MRPDASPVIGLEEFVGSLGGVGPIFPKKWEKKKLEFSEKSRFSGFPREIPKQTARPQIFPGSSWEFPGIFLGFVRDSPGILCTGLQTDFVGF